MLLGSCIVADPPEYRNPVQTRPLLNVYLAVPSTQQILVVDSTLGTKFTVPVRSEDNGEDLTALFFLDYQVHPGEFRLLSQNIPASTYDNTDREATFTWKPMGDHAGCHYISLIVAHRGSFQNVDGDHLDPAAGERDAAIVSWIVNVGPTVGQENTLKDCPVSKPPVL